LEAGRAKEFVVMIERTVSEVILRQKFAASSLQTTNAKHSSLCFSVPDLVSDHVVLSVAEGAQTAVHAFEVCKRVAVAFPFDHDPSIAMELLNGK
jgi:hypothetical protein